jgi:hypothetical protein
VKENSKVKKQGTKGARDGHSRPDPLHRIVKPAIFWAVYNPSFGFYTDTAITRREMVEKHCSALGESWDYCKAKGDSVIKVRIQALA